MSTGPGVTPAVRVVTATDDRSFAPYGPALPGGVNVAMGDIDGDGTPDIITGAGPGGGPHVRVFSGVDFHELASFFVYDPSFAGGVFVAAGDVDGDGRADIITGAGAGGSPHVRVFSGVDLHEIASFYAYTPVFAGGVHVAAADIDGDGRSDIITGAGPGGGPHVRVFSGVDLHELASFFAYPAAFVGGVFVGAGDVDGDGRADIITGAGAGGGPHVRVFSGVDLHELASFFAYDAAFAGGVHVAAGNLNDDGRVDVITGAGPGGDPHVKAFSGTNFAQVFELLAFDSASGVSVASTGDAGVGVGASVRFTSALSATFDASTSGKFTVRTAGSPPPSLTSTGTLPSGVTFVDNGDGTATLSGPPSIGGVYPLAFTAANGIGAPATQAFTLMVRQAPAITSATSVTFTPGTAGSFTVTTTGFPAPTLTESRALPAGITFVDNGNGTGALHGIATAGSAGTYALQFTAANSLAGVVQNFTLNVRDITIPPQGAPLIMGPGPEAVPWCGSSLPQRIARWRHTLLHFLAA